MRKNALARRSDRHLEFLGGAEGYLFAGLDLDRLTGHRIAAHVLSPDAERALKPGQAFRECAKDCPEMIVVPAGEFMRTE